MVGLPMHIIQAHAQAQAAAAAFPEPCTRSLPNPRRALTSHAQLTAGLMTVTNVIGAITNATNDAAHTLLNPHRRVRWSSMIHRPRG
jgi:hypothetical protein